MQVGFGAEDLWNRHGGPVLATETKEDTNYKNADKNADNITITVKFRLIRKLRNYFVRDRLTFFKVLITHITYK